MSAVEESVKQVPLSEKRVERKRAPFFSRALAFISSVRLGIVLLCILVFLSFLGMIIIQQNVNGFDAYYASLTPAERTVYGALGLFNVYYSYYFNGLLLLLSLNIVLASIDRFPTAWSYIVKPKLFGTRGWMERQLQHEAVEISGDSSTQIGKKVAAAFQGSGLKPQVTEKDGKTYVFGENGKWNRLGAYLVHIALLTLFLGHFLAFWTGFDADVNFTPGQVTSEIQMIEQELDQRKRFAVRLPFTIECTDIQQKLIDPNGSIEPFNTLDWRTQIKIDDPQYGVTTADVSLNKPFSYRGYRFFQAQTVPVGNARTMKLELTPQQAGAEPFTVDLKRNGKTELPDGTLIEYQSFLADFTFNQNGQPDTKSGDYNNPAAVLQVTPKDGEKTRVFAFAGNVGDNIPVGAPKVGYKWRLKEFEKAPLAHVLSIKYDPYNGAFIAWYFGGIGLILALVFVFFISHKRVWASIEPSEFAEKFEVLLSGDTNRNHLNFEDRFAKIVSDITGLRRDSEENSS